MLFDKIMNQKIPPSLFTYDLTLTSGISILFLLLADNFYGQPQTQIQGTIKSLVLTSVFNMEIKFVPKGHSK